MLNHVRDEVVVGDAFWIVEAEFPYKGFARAKDVPRSSREFDENRPYLRIGQPCHVVLDGLVVDSLVAQQRKQIAARSAGVLS